MRGSARLGKGLLLCGIAAAAVALAAPKPAAARGFIHFGIGLGVPVGPAYYPPPVYYPAYPPPAYYPPYPPAPAYYPAYPAPVYEPPPAVAYAPPPAYAESAPAAPECREYTAISRIGGRAQQIVGTACLQPDGTWRIIR